MKKQLLSFVFLTALPLTLPLTAAPNDTTGSTEQADRQFLQSLEQADTAKATRGPNAPTPVEVPAPVVPGAAKADAKPVTAQARPVAPVVQKPRTIVLADDFDQSTQPDEVAAYDLTLQDRPATVTRVVVVKPARSVHVERHHTERRPLHHLISRLLSFHPEDW